MRHAETVTFGGSGLDRAASLRDDPTRVAAALAGGRFLVLWRGKPLMSDADALAWLPAGHAVLEGAGPPVLLGLEGEVASFAVDLAGWQPEGDLASVGGFTDPSRQRHLALPPDLGFAELRGLMARLTPRDAEFAATARAVLGWHATHGFCAACGAATDMVKAGWQRLCPACSAHHFPRTDPVVIMLVTRGNSVLVGRSPGWPEGMYSLLAGFVEPGETMEAAVRREVAEETGVRVGPVRYLASQPWPFPASLMLGCAAEALSETITLDPVELEDALWVSREVMMTVMAGAHPTLKASRKGAIAHFLIESWLADRLD